MPKLAQNKPIFTIREPIKFTHLAVMKEKPKEQGVGKTMDGQALRPEPEKSPIIPVGQKTTFKKWERTHSLQDVRLSPHYSANNREKITLVFWKKRTLILGPGGPS